MNLVYLYQISPDTYNINYATFSSLYVSLMTLFRDTKSLVVEL